MAPDAPEFMTIRWTRLGALEALIWVVRSAAGVPCPSTREPFSAPVGNQGSTYPRGQSAPGQRPRIETVWSCLDSFTQAGPPPRFQQDPPTMRPSTVQTPPAANTARQVEPDVHEQLHREFCQRQPKVDQFPATQF
jgi:hypothetical protein